MLQKDTVSRTRKLRQSGELLKDGSLHYVLFTDSVGMRPIVRRSAEFMTATVTRRAREFDVIVNGNYFGATRWGTFDALVGHDPVDATETRIEGLVAQAGLKTVGDSRPNRFYIEEIAEMATNKRPGRLRYATGFGDPPRAKNAVAAIGNVGPLISRGLPYGKGNVYRRGTTGPPTGDPGPLYRRKLIQRNDATFVSVDTRSPPTGKTVIAYHAREQALLVAVQPDGRHPGQTYGQLRDKLIVAGFSDAVFLDGSDSSMLWHRGKCIVAPGENKDELMTVALGFDLRAGR